MRPHRRQPTRLLHSWDSPGKNTGVGCHFLLQGIFPTQGSNPGLPHCRQTLYRLSHKGSQPSYQEILLVLCSKPVQNLALSPLLHHSKSSHGHFAVLWKDPQPGLSASTLALLPTARKSLLNLQSVQFSSVAQSCPTLCDPMNCSTPGLPVHHQLPEFTQTHVHRVGDAIQLSHPLSSPSPPAPNPSQHQSLFQ